ncbi:hypothetical protein [Ideonella margarita]|uniref:Entry exclusion lipoprotein TrbK n=1 Tax=Ideonella margarita TaxID=2984191 RepID=A0ABU9C9J7_9BURK
MKYLVTTAALSVFLTGCAAPPRVEWTKEGASTHDRESVLSECLYSVKMNKVGMTEQDELVGLCMKSKGYRLRKVG